MGNVLLPGVLGCQIGPYKQVYIQAEYWYLIMQ